ncbi:MAG: hypothetical protein HC896_01760 [Bacteroidales bacterium]|nr:hypothetical protein [Bacteroidales bacterium]
MSSFALPEALAKLRASRGVAANNKLVAISAADPLNLTGIVTPGKRVAGIFSNRILYKMVCPLP